MKPKPELIDYHDRTRGMDAWERDLAEWVAEANLEAAERIEKAVEELRWLLRHKT